ncbi:hypothetical protein J4443_03170 [Candidatus Woesearchaeota archaeon]|nr:hypothetical protein [Candidatus Woesearchaeota archaeon]
MRVDNFIKKINEIKEKSSLDISAWEDLSIGLMNLVSLEEHCFFSYVRTQDDKFLKMLEAVRELRKKLLALIIKKDDDSERWCMSKHLLASSMRLFEVGNRLLHEGKEKEAKEMYKDSAELYGLFWALNVEGKGKIKINEDSKETKGIFASIKKLLECCIE